MKFTFLILDRNFNTLEIPGTDADFNVMLHKHYGEVKSHKNRNQLNKTIDEYIRRYEQDEQTDS